MIRIARMMSQMIEKKNGENRALNHRKDALTGAGKIRMMRSSHIFSQLMALLTNIRQRDP